VPFTPAHAVAVLPFRKTRLNLPAMVVGSLSPDFEFFLRLAPGTDFGHSWLGILVLDLPLSLIVLWLYQSYLRHGLYAVAPRLFPFREETLKERPAFHGWKQLMLILVSILLGALTHILWDSFTHDNMWPYAHIAWLRIGVHLPLHHYMQIDDVLQYLSSAVGVAILFMLWARWIRTAPRPVPQPAAAFRELWIALIIMAAFAALLRAEIGIRNWQGHITIISETVVTFITALWIQLLIAGMVYRHRRYERN
jgi:Domain of unknown function (DUF4184)